MGRHSYRRPSHFPFARRVSCRCRVASCVVTLGETCVCSAAQGGGERAHGVRGDPAGVRGADQQPEHGRRHALPQGRLPRPHRLRAHARREGRRVQPRLREEHLPAPPRRLQRFAHRLLSFLSFLSFFFSSIVTADRVSCVSCVSCDRRTDNGGSPAFTNMYGSHPFYMELRSTGAHGVFLLNSNGTSERACAVVCVRWCVRSSHIPRRCQAWTCTRVRSS